MCPHSSLQINELSTEVHSHETCVRGSMYMYHGQHDGLDEREGGYAVWAVNALRAALTVDCRRRPRRGDLCTTAGLYCHCAAMHGGALRHSETPSDPAAGMQRSAVSSTSKGSGRTAAHGTRALRACSVAPRRPAGGR